MRNTLRNTVRNWMLSAVVLGGVGGLFTVGAAAANAAPVRLEVGYGSNYRPAWPGEGYVWVDGYYNGGYWVPGAWVFEGYRGAVGYGGYGIGYRGGYGRDLRFDRDRRDFREGSFVGRDRNSGGERRFDGNRGPRNDHRPPAQGGGRERY